MTLAIAAQVNYAAYQLPSVSTEKAGVDPLPFPLPRPRAEAAASALSDGTRQGARIQSSAARQLEPESAETKGNVQPAGQPSRDALTYPDPDKRPQAGRALDVRV